MADLHPSLPFLLSLVSACLVSIFCGCSRTALGQVELCRDSRYADVPFDIVFLLTDVLGGCQLSALIINQRLRRKGKRECWDSLDAQG